MKIGTLEVGGENPCRVVAELSNNHGGDRDRLGRLIDAAQAAGADAIKVQCFAVDELCALRGEGPAPEPWGSQGFTMRTLYEKAQTPLDWFPKIADHCERVGMPWFSSVFGAESLACLEAVGCPALKVSHFEAGNEMLAELVLETEKPVPILVSEGSVPVAKSYFTGAIHLRPRPGVGLLYCPGGYPAALTDLHLERMSADYLGLSLHCRDPLVGPVAVARGAKLIEVHFMLQAEPSELESNVSLVEHELEDLVQAVRDTERMLG